MKVTVQVVNTMTNAVNSCTIDEPVKKGHEVDNALKHLGVSFGEIEWDENLKKSEYDNFNVMVGTVPGTTKVITVVAYGE